MVLGVPVYKGSMNFSSVVRYFTSVTAEESMKMVGSKSRCLWPR